MKSSASADVGGVHGLLRLRARPAQVQVGRHPIIGAQAVVREDVPDYGVAVGVPAKVIAVRQP